MPKRNFKNNYETACNDYVKELCKRYDWSFEDGWWVSNEIGGTFCTSDIEYSLSMNDIKLLVDENVDFKIFSKWWDYNLVMSYAIMLYPNNDKYHMINLHTWLNNYPDNRKISQKELNKIEKIFWGNNKMEGFKQRLVKEREELKEKTDKLHDFLFSQAFMNLDEQQKTLLREQYRIMTQYLNILKLRIDITLTKEEKEELKNE